MTPPVPRTGYEALQRIRCPTRCSSKLSSLLFPFSSQDVVDDAGADDASDCHGDDGGDGDDVDALLFYYGGPPRN